MALCIPARIRLHIQLPAKFIACGMLCACLAGSWPNACFAEPPVTKRETPSTLNSLGQSTAAQASAVISLKERVSTTQTLVTLNEVAEILSSDNAFRETLGNIPLGPGPGVGRPVMFDHLQVHQRLLAMGINLSRIEFSGSARSVVSRSAGEERAPQVIQQVSHVEPQPVIRVDRGKVEALLVTAFREQFRWGDEAAMPIVTISPHEATPPAVLQAVTDGAAIRYLAEKIDNLPEQAIQAQIIPTSGGEPQNVTLKLKLTPQVRMVAFRRAMQKGEIVQQGDLMWKLDTAQAECCTEPGQVIGMECRRATKAGELVNLKDMASAPLIRNGDIVTASLRVKGIVIRGQYKSLSTAARGETVTLVSLDDVRERVTAVVTGWHEAAITSTGGEGANPSQMRGVQLLKSSSQEDPPAKSTPSRQGGRP